LLTLYVELYCIWVHFEVQFPYALQTDALFE